MVYSITNVWSTLNWARGCGSTLLCAFYDIL